MGKHFRLSVYIIGPVWRSDESLRGNTVQKRCQCQALSGQKEEKKKATTKNENEASTVTEGSKRTFQGESCEMLRSSEMEILLFDLKHFSFGAG